MSEQEKSNVQENKTVEDYLLTKFFTSPDILSALCQIISENPEIEEAVSGLMSCPEVEAIKGSLTSLFLANFSEGHLLEQLTTVANGGDVDAFLMQNPSVLNVLSDSPLVAELLQSMELGLLKAMGLESQENPVNKRLADECYNLALLIVELPAFQEAMDNVDFD